MHNLNIKATEQIWLPITNLICVPHNDNEYDKLMNLLDDLIDEVGEDETHPLASMMELIGILIEYYETKHVSELTND